MREALVIGVVTHKTVLSLEPMMHVQAQGVPLILSPSDPTFKEVAARQACEDARSVDRLACKPIGFEVLCSCPEPT